MWRTVRNDLTVQLDGIFFEPKDAFAESLMRKWVGRRVYVRDFSYWGSEIVAEPRRNSDVMQQAHLVCGQRVESHSAREAKEST